MPELSPGPSSWRRTGHSRHLHNLGLGLIGFRDGVFDGRWIGYQTPVALIGVVVGVTRHAAADRWLAIALAIGGLMFAKITNTIAERLSELFLEGSTGDPHAYDPRVKRVKDMGAGLVLASMATAAAVYAIVAVAPG
jgi:diacylglycerol kinase